MRTPGNPIIMGRINGNGTVATGTGFTARKTGTGTFVLTFPATFRVSALTANFNGTGNATVSVNGPTGDDVTLTTFNPGNGVAVDYPFVFIATGR